MKDNIWSELEDFASKASGDRKTQVASCVVTVTGTSIFGANHLRDGHGLTAKQITDRIRPTFYDAMKCAEEDALDKAEEMNIDLTSAKLYSLRFPCVRCAEKISKTKIKSVVAHNHKPNNDTGTNGSLESSMKIFNKAGIEFDIGDPLYQ